MHDPLMIYMESPVMMWDLPPLPRKDGEPPYAGVIYFQGLEVLVETPRGAVRSGVDRDGRVWSVTLPAHYGEIVGTHGADNEPIDAFVGENAEAPMAFIIHQKVVVPDEHYAPGAYDEDKVMLGFNTQDEAMAAWRDSYNLVLTQPMVTRIRVCDLAHHFAAQYTVNEAPRAPTLVVTT